MKKPVHRNPTSDSSIEEAGAITFRRTNDGALEVLLILSKKKPRVRIFPKGHIEPGESAAEAARRELLEEAGILGRQIHMAGTVSYNFRGLHYRVAYYLFQYETYANDGEKGRDPRWYPLKDAYAILPFKGLQEVLNKADKEAISKI